MSKVQENVFCGERLQEIIPKKIIRLDHSPYTEQKRNFIADAAMFWTKDTVVVGF